MPIPKRNLNLPIDAIDPDWIKRGRTFTISGLLRGRPVSVTWHPAPGDRLGSRLRGDSELVSEIEMLIALRRGVDATPTGPSFQAALDPPHVALVTISAALDRDAAHEASGAVPRIPGMDVPPGAIP